MVIYYGTAGFIADLALALNVLIIMAAMAALRATLTLPGIAGIILGVGMAVDANVLIFERIREELRAGKPFRQAVDAGFSRAFSAIFDSNLTTLIAAALLFQFGTGPLRGFAVTLCIGLVANLFTAVWVTRTIMDYLISQRRVVGVGISLASG
jgi:preprotein translocase subunit SecD